MAAYTLAELRTAVLERIEFEGTGFVGMDELKRYINDAYEKLWHFLVTVYDSEYFAASACATTSTTCNVIDLPADFLKLISIQWWPTPTEPITLRPFRISEITEDTSDWSASTPRYRLTYNSVIFWPKPTTEEKVEILYVPTCLRLSAETDALKTPAWWEYVVVEAFRKCLVKEESDTSGVVAELLDIERQIKASASLRDIHQPQLVVDDRAFQEVDW